MTFTPSRSEDPAAMIRSERRGSVLLATIDMPGRTMNVFSWGMMDAIEALLDRVDADPEIGAVVLTSGKSTFLAGADLEMVLAFTSMAPTAAVDDLIETTGRLGRLFCRLEASTKPFVAAINGLARGGGLVLTMACHRRLAADDRRVQLGLPEIKLGLLAGAGGTQRLPRLIGMEKGMDYLLNGRSLDPDAALALGLVDAVVPAADLIERAIAEAAALVGSPPPVRMPTRLDPAPFDPDAPDAVRRITRHFGHPDAVTDLYPAYDHIVKAVLEGRDLPLPEGDHVEIVHFVDLIRDRVAGNMVATLFIARQRADKAPLEAAGTPRRFAVIGSGPAFAALEADLRKAKAEIVAPDQIGPDDVTIGPVGSTADLQFVDDAATEVRDGAGFVLRRSPDHGTALEVFGTVDAAARAKAMALALRLRATPCVHAGTRSLLAALEAVPGALDDPDRQAHQRRIAAEFAAAGAIDDPELADVIAVVGGVFPAHAGGPFRAQHHLGR